MKEAHIIDYGPNVWTIEVYTYDGDFCFTKHFYSETAMRSWLEANEEWLEY